MTPLLTKPKPGAMINPLHPLARGLVGCWLLNDGSGSSIRDISSKNNHGTLINGPTWTGSKFGGGLDFDGTDNYVNINPGTDYDNMTAMTVSAWFKSDVYTGNRNIISKWHYSSPQDLGWILHYSSYSNSMRVEWAYNDTNSGDDAIAGPIPPTTGQWYHIVAVWTTTSRVLYVDAVPGTADTNTRTSISDTTANLIIGSQADLSNFFDGVSVKIASSSIF